MVRSHKEERWLFEEPTQSHISPSTLRYTKIRARDLACDVRVIVFQQKVRRLLTPPALRAGSDRPSQALDLYWRSPRSGDMCRKSRRLKQTISSPYEGWWLTRAYFIPARHRAGVCTGKHDCYTDVGVLSCRINRGATKAQQNLA